jgi:hypothetical protein
LEGAMSVTLPTILDRYFNAQNAHGIGALDVRQ